jgi:hypothetical protein
MTPKTATAKLYVTALSLLTAALELGAALVRLVSALVLRGATAVRPRPKATRLPARPNLRVVPPPSVDLERGRLVTALAGMGWPLPRVRAFVDGLGDRVGREPLAALIREGLAELAA